MKTIKKITNHKIFFWISIFFVITHFVFLLQNKYYSCLLIFSALCFIMKQYSKNLAIALIVAVFISSFIFGCSQYREGMLDKNNLEEMANSIKSGKINTNGLENIQKMMSQMDGLKKNNETNMNLDMGSLNELLKFNNKISSSNLTSKNDVKKAVDHLRSNKDLLKKMIDKF